MPKLSRRTLIVSGLVAGGALLVGYARHRLDDGDATAKFGAGSPDVVALNPWIKVAPDGTVTFGIHRAEMGQAIVTTIAMILAEEMDADWSRVRYEFTPIDRDYYNFGFVNRAQPFGDPERNLAARTGTAALREVMRGLGLAITVSSASTIDAWETLRPVAAATRAVLLQAGAARLGVPADQLEARDGFVRHAASGRALGYGELAADAARLDPPDRPALKDPANYRLVGRDPPRLELPAKVDGSAVFGLDVRPAGLKHAAILRCPVFGGSVRSFDDAAARAVRGYERTEQLLPDTLAVVARDSWSAMQAAGRLAIDWAPPPEGTPQVSSAQLLDEYRGLFDSPEPLLAREREADASGDATAPAGAAAARVFEREYAVPYLAHACLEPMNATAQLQADGTLDLWAPTQSPSIARTEAASAAGVEPDRVRVHSTLLGGGFGRRAELDYVVVAATLAARMPGVPVQAFWSREQDLQHDMYRPAAACRLRAVIAPGDTAAAGAGTTTRADAAAAVRAIDVVVVAQSVLASNAQRIPSPRTVKAAKDKSIASGISDCAYAWPAPQVAVVGRELPVPVGFWRSVSHSYAGFFVDSFIDELATELGVAPLELRRRWLAGHPRALAVLEAAARHGRMEEPLPAGEGRGIGLSESHGSIAAHVVHLRAAPSLQLLRVTSVIDCGRALRPASVRAQVEGSVIDGLWAALRSDLRIEAGRVVQSNFHDYPLLRIGEVPPIDVHIVESSERPGGVGEPAVPGIAPALCAAWFAATGQRQRRLPMQVPA
jgi:isoquinoline 1-oxidoreductase beta subunit